MKVVVDTNVFVSSFFGGKPKRVIDRWKTGRITLCLSEPILNEYVRVLEQMELGGDQELGELLELFRKQYNLVYTSEPPDLNVVEEDPEDDKFIEAAVALEAEVIVTGDQSLRHVGSYMGIRLRTPDEFLE